MCSARAGRAAFAIPQVRYNALDTSRHLASPQTSAEPRLLPTIVRDDVVYSRLLYCIPGLASIQDHHLSCHSDAHAGSRGMKVSRQGVNRSLQERRTIATHYRYSKSFIIASISWTAGRELVFQQSPSPAAARRG